MVHEMAKGASSCGVVNEKATDTTKLNKRTAPTLQAPLSALATSGATIDLSIPDTTETIINESRAKFVAPIQILHKVEPWVPR